jgi:hypothetical protein
MLGKACIERLKTDTNPNPRRTAPGRLEPVASAATANAYSRPSAATGDRRLSGSQTSQSVTARSVQAFQRRIADTVELSRIDILCPIVHREDGGVMSRIVKS